MRIFLSLIIALSLCGMPAADARAGEKDAKRVCIRAACVTAETAADPDARARGLMYRDGLAPDTGMLFVFDRPGEHAFWMMNMKFALDMIWITPDLRVAAVSENVPPCAPGKTCESISPGIECAYVLEVPAGFSRRYAIAAGDTVTIH